MKTLITLVGIIFYSLPESVFASQKLYNPKPICEEGVFVAILIGTLIALIIAILSTYHEIHDNSSPNEGC